MNFCVGLCCKMLALNVQPFSDFRGPGPPGSVSEAATAPLLSLPVAHRGLRGPRHEAPQVLRTAAAYPSSPGASCENTPQCSCSGFCKAF